MTEQERRIVNHALKILELNQDDESRKLAAQLVERGTKVPLQSVRHYAAYMSGMRAAYLKMFELIKGGGWLAKVSKKDMPYFDAEKRLVESCIDACYDYHIGKYEIAYKDGVVDKKGKLVSCRAVLVKPKIVAEEVVYTKKGY